MAMQHETPAYSFSPAMMEKSNRSEPEHTRPVSIVTRPDHMLAKGVSSLKLASLVKSPRNQSEMRGISVMSFRIKQLVSKEKRRFEDGGFNLDLTYVTDRLVAFGYPAERFEGIYRNHYKDVYNFFEKRHGQKYKIYNLCSERNYKKDKFHNRVAEYPFDDHCPPPIRMLISFCQDVDQWLQQDPEHVAAVHCKAGKGRTGVMICCYLLYAGIWKTAHGALAHFAAARSLKREGVTIPSQRRFVAYFEIMCRGLYGQETDPIAKDRVGQRELAMTSDQYHNAWEKSLDGQCQQIIRTNVIAIPNTQHFVLVKITIDGVYAHRRIDPRIRVECPAKTGKKSDAASRAASEFLVCHDLPCLFTTNEAQDAKEDTQSPIRYLVHKSESMRSLYRPSSAPTSRQSAVANLAPTSPKASVDPLSTASTVSMTMQCKRLLLWDESKVTMRNRSGKILGQFWIHTAFIDVRAPQTTLLKHEIDKVFKDVKNRHAKYASSFKITLFFEPATDADLNDYRTRVKRSSMEDELKNELSDLSRTRCHSVDTTHEHPKLRPRSKSYQLDTVDEGNRK